MEEKDIELALYVIDLKIAKEVKENTEPDYEKFAEKITKLKDERNEILKNNEQVISKVLNEYKKDVQIKKGE